MSASSRGGRTRRGDGGARGAPGPSGKASSRADRLLVERGLVPTREKAQALILAGRVSAGGRRVEKPGAFLPSEAELAVAPGPRFVGRGGDKLDGALTRFGIDARDARVLDVGASTGGFTDCLLQRGARHVVALDVGRGQLDWSLRNDPRVTVVEGVNVRWLGAEDVAGPFDLIVVDVSFISLKLVLPTLVPRLAARANAPREPSIVALVKPQFEVGRGEVGKGGIVRDASKQLAALVEVIRFADGLPVRAEGDAAFRLGVLAVTESPLRGAEGNREFFVRFVPGPGVGREAAEKEARRVVDGGSQG
jgi:23S rRNA (cytidine1920-2'-O)/16S rRNA (cytidine1409-2'-O)-methyltransferase